MTATLSSRCHCGRTVSVPCPTLDDMGAACDAIERLGWVWDPRVGNACSPACAEASAQDLAAKQAPAIRRSKSAPVAPPEWPSLFDERSDDA